jgi:hypothetical protein
MQKLSKQPMICANVRLMRLDFELAQGVEQCADVHAT